MTSLTKEQELSVRTIDSNVLVSAGAGSGKTHVLVERYIEILRCDRKLAVSNLVAVTYTTKAANEMRSRLKARMQELMKGEGEDREHWAECLSGVDGARIGTIHSLCESILKAFPAEAAIDPRFEVLNELERAELLDSCLELAIYQAAEEGGEDGELLLAYPVEQIKRWVSTLIGRVLQYQESKDRLPGLSDDELDRHLRTLLQAQHYQVAEKILTSDLWIENVEYLRNNPWSKGGKLEDHRVNVLRLADAANGSGNRTEGEESTTRLANLKDIVAVKVATAGASAPGAEELRASIRVLREMIKEQTKDLELDPLPEDREAFKFLRGIIRLTDRVLKLFAEEKKAGMRLDFNDMIVSAYQVLSRPESQARKFYNENVRAILVDEFQDTNRLQAQLIQLLAGESTRLFLIGDDKQSIYKFQGADVSIFNEWRDNFGRGQPNLLVDLGTSFRSHPQIVALVNAVFAKLMPEEELEVAYKARYRPLDAYRNDPAGEPRVDVVLFDATDQAGERNSDEAKRLEARSTASWIAEKVLTRQTIVEKGSGGSRPIRFGDFAVLVQMNEQFKEIEDALSELAIPYVTMAASGFLRRQEVYDLENVLRFLWCQQDDQSLLGALRSPMFAVTDEVLHQLYSGYNSTLWTTCQIFSLGNEGRCAELDRAVAVLRSLVALARSSSLGELVRAVIVATRYDVALLAVPGGKQRSRNVWKVASLADEHSVLSIGEFATMLDRMRDLKVKQSHAPLDAGDSVKLMTIHGSKGLEFPAVALPAMSGSVQGKSEKLLFHRHYGLAFDHTRDRSSQKPALYLVCRQLEKDMEQEERKRLLYVASTRARDHLGIFMERGGKNVVSFRSWINDVLELDRGGALTEDGVYLVSGGSSDAGYRVQSNDLEKAAVNLADLKERLATLRRERALASAESAGGNLRPAFDLIPPIKFEEAQPSTNWQTILRVTPSSQDQELEATVIGTFFHAIMEHLSDRVEPPSRKLLAELAAGAGVGIVHRQKLDRLLTLGEEMLDKFYGSELCELMKKAGKLIHEAPYKLLSKDGTLSPEVTVAGRSDLLLQAENGQWYVIDYKTDEFNLGEIDRQASSHRAQLEAYVDHIERLTGVRAKPALYFARYGLFLPYP